MTVCDRLTYTGLETRLKDLSARRRNLEISKDQHGEWVQERGTQKLGRIAYRFVDGPFVVLWTIKHPKISPDSSLMKRLFDAEERDPHCWSLCEPDCLDLRTDLPPETWFNTDHSSGWSVKSLLAEADIHEIGVVRWGRAVPLDVPGIYIVALADGASRTDATHPWAQFGKETLPELLLACDGLRIDGQRPSVIELRERIGSFWLSNQTALYVGKAGTSVRSRVNQYYRTPLGARSPHAGGWFLKTLTNLNSLFVHFGATDSPEEAERRILEAFTASESTVTNVQLSNTDLTLPFANLQLPGGRRKSHGITGATGCDSSKGTENTENRQESVTAASQQRGITLHQEITAILKANGDRWMSTSEIALEVQQRGNYKKRDGTSNVTPYQVHGRTKNYPHLFERDGSRVRLTETAAL